MKDNWHIEAQLYLVNKGNVNVDSILLYKEKDVEILRQKLIKDLCLEFDEILQNRY
jgi:hypothetical protein